MTARLRVSNAGMEQKVRDLGVAYAELENKNLQLEDAQDQLVRNEKLAAIGQLAGGVAHDLRNPLGAIKNAIYYLNRKLGTNQEAMENPRIGQFLNIIEEEVDHSNQIITDLLSFTRLGTLSVSNVNLGEIIENTLSSVELRERTQIIKEFDVELPEVLADGDQLQRVFANLTLNAQDAMPEGGVLTIATRREDGFAPFMIYGPSFKALYKRAATFTHKILNGANPSEMPVEHPIAFDLVVNLDAAEAIGITFPESFLLRTTEMVRN